MTTPEPAVESQDGHPLRAARVRGLAARQRLLLAQGGTLSRQQVAMRVGLTPRAVDQRQHGGRLIAVNTGRRGLAYPAWQFESEQVLAGIEGVLSDLAIRDGWMQTAFFLSGDPRLEGATPLDELRGGNVGHGATPNASESSVAYQSLTHHRIRCVGPGQSPVSLDPSHCSHLE